MHKLQDYLEGVWDKYHRPELLESDPIEFVHRYSDPLNQEIVGLVAALLAYGNVKQIRASVADLLARMERDAASPRDFVKRLQDPSGWTQGKKALKGFTHRFNVGGDLAVLLHLMGQSQEEYGSLGAHFLQNLKPEDPHIEDALDGLIQNWRVRAEKLSPKKSFQYLLTTPKDGSCCKRWCMYLRWMGRHDKIDLGLWTETSLLAPTFAGRSLKSSQLVIPLDTHTGRISQKLGLTRRKTLGWRTALEVTQNLSKIDAHDPVRFDFALSRLGILDVPEYRELLERSSP